LVYKPQYSWGGLLIVLTGIPIYYVAKRYIKDEEITTT
jgi:APA family basic amino acid/polyamine antiporter